MRHASGFRTGPGASVWLAAALALLSGGACLAGTGKSGGTCEDCHSYMSRKSQEIVKEWRDSVHATVDVGCADCHGGDPKNSSMDGAMSRAAGYTGTPKRTEIARLCARCHADPVRMRPFNLPTSQYDQYLTSVHGKRMAAGDTRAATCVDCHSVHDVRRKNDVLSPVYKSNIATTCARCHSDEKLMKPYGIPTDQHDEYMRSIHGQKLVKERDIAAPSCADCHGTHGATPPGVAEVSDVCGRCHTLLERQFSKGAHRQAVKEHGVPRCVDCHGNHGVVMPSDEKLIGDGQGECGSCHPKGTPQFDLAQKMYDAIAGTQRQHDDVRKELQRVASLHEDIADGMVALAQADTSLKEARASVHGVSLEGISAQVDDARLSVKRAADVAQDGASRSFWRRANVALAAFIFLAISALLYTKWSTLHRRWLRQAPLDEDALR